jgi:hypothetical protein
VVGLAFPLVSVVRADDIAPSAERNGRVKSGQALPVRPSTLEKPTLEYLGFEADDLSAEERALEPTKRHPVPGGTVRYAARYRPTATTAPAVELRVSYPDVATVTDPGGGQLDSAHRTLSWQLSDADRSAAEVTKRFSLALAPEIPFGGDSASRLTLSVGARLSTKDVQERAETSVDLFVHLRLTTKTYHGDPVPGLFLDALKVTKDDSLLEDSVNKHLTKVAGDQEGTLDAWVKRADLDEPGKLRLTAGFANDPTKLEIRTGLFKRGDVLSTVTPPLELSPGWLSEHAIEFTDSAAEQWAYPIDHDLQRQTLMASVIWRTLYRAKQVLATSSFGVGEAPGSLLQVNLLPTGTTFSSYDPTTKQLSLSERVWQPRSRAAWAPHTELHELGHWALQLIGVEKGRVSGPDRIQQLDVDLIDEPEPGACGRTSVKMVSFYFMTQLASQAGQPLPTPPRTAQCGRAYLHTELGNELARVFKAAGQAGREPRYSDSNFNPHDPAQTKKAVADFRSSLDHGVPVIVFTSYYGQHIFVLTGYAITTVNGRTTTQFLANDPLPNRPANSMNARTNTLSVNHVALSESELFTHFNYPGGGAAYFAYLGSQSFGRPFTYQGEDADSYGYLNTFTNRSLMEGAASWLAVALNRQLNGQADWLYQNEQGSVLYSLDEVHPAFTNVSHSHRVEPSGEGWVVASLLKTLTTGYTGPATFPWIASTQLQSYRQPTSPQLGTPGVVAALRRVGSAHDTTVGTLRDTVANQHATPVDLKTSDGHTIGTTDTDLRFGLFGFFPDYEGNRILDPVNFTDQGKLGRTAHGGKQTFTVPDIREEWVGLAAPSSVIAPPAPSLGRANGPTTRSGEQIQFMTRTVGGSRTRRMLGRPLRKQPLERSGSQIILTAPSPTLTLDVTVRFAEPYQSFSYAYRQAVASNEPVTLALPYDDYDSAAVVQVEGSADALVIGSDQYWSLMDSETPPTLLATRSVSLGGTPSSVDALLAEAGYRSDGQREATPPSQPRSTPATATLASANVDRSATAGRVVVVPGESVTLTLANLSGSTATVLFDDQPLATVPLLGDGQAVSVTVPAGAASGSHTVSVEPEGGASLVQPLTVRQSVEASRRNTALLGLVGGLMVALVFWRWRRRGGRTGRRGR